MGARTFGWMLALVLVCGVPGCARKHSGRHTQRADADVRDDPTAESDAAFEEEPVPLDDGATRDATPVDVEGPRDSAQDASVPGVKTVRGRVMGPLRNPIPGWQVALGEQVVVSDEQGAFTFEDVSLPYDLYLRTVGGRGTELWEFRGLTRTDPTLQTDYARGSTRGQLEIEPINVPALESIDAGLGSGTVLELAFGSDQIAFDWRSTQTENYAGVFWFGDQELRAVMHGLAVARPPGADPTGLDNVYLAYVAVAVSLQPVLPTPNAQRLTLDFSMSSVRTQPFKLRAEADWGDPALVNRRAYGMVVFDSHAALSLTSPKTDAVWGAAPTTVPMPVPPASHVVFQGFQETERTVPLGPIHGFGCAHGEAVSAEEPVVLRIPEPRSLVAPADHAERVDHATTFEWSAGGAVSLLSVRCHDMLFHVVSAGHSATLPKSSALGVALLPNKACVWHVAVHGAYASVDDALHPEGMLVPCAGYVDGVSRGEGSGSRSELWSFRTGP